MRLYKSKKEIKQSNNRINFIMAVIFLFGGAVLLRLYNIQVRQFDLYTALASSQHQAYKVLEPNRGRIFIQDKAEEEKKLYPIATNKELALIYANPNLINDIEVVSHALYHLFDKERVLEEVGEILEDYIEDNNIEVDEEGRPMDSQVVEFIEIKKELEIKPRKDKIINNYLSKLGKRDDPYEPLAKKVEEDKLIKFFATIDAIKKLNQEIDIWNEEGGEDKYFDSVDDTQYYLDKKIVYKKNYESGEDEEVKIEGLDYMWELHRYYPEGNIGSQMIGFVGYVDNEQRGRYGLEGFFDEELYGKFGEVKADRDASGNLIIINDREFEGAEDGKDLILSIDRSIQYQACSKLNKAVQKHGADSGSVIIMEPSSGAIIAMCSSPDYDPNYYQDEDDIQIFNNPSIFAQYEPGSIFKTITLAASINEKAISPSTTYNDYGSVMVEGWPKPIKNSDFETYGAHGTVTMTKVLEESLNTGSIFAMEQIGAPLFSEYVQSFGFGEKTGIELETESKGDIRNLLADKIKPVDAAVATFGQGITVTPLQMVNSYATIANNGVLMKPYLVKEVIDRNGGKVSTQPRQIKRVITEKTAVLISGMLVNVIDGGHAKNAAVKGYYLGGKTGTAQVAESDKKGYSDKTIHTFVGFGPIEDPQFVMLVKLDDPKDVQYSASSAAPLFGEIAEFILSYWEIPKTR